MGDSSAAAHSPETKVHGFRMPANKSQPTADIGLGSVSAFRWCVEPVDRAPSKRESATSGTVVLDRLQW
jgi:hypothetical protein